MHDFQEIETFFHQWRFCGNVVSAACVTLQNVLLLLLHHTAGTQPLTMRLRNSADEVLLSETTVCKSRRFSLSAPNAASVVWIGSQAAKQRAEQTVGASAVARHFRAALLMQPLLALLWFDGFSSSAPAP